MLMGYFKLKNVMKQTEVGYNSVVTLQFDYMIHCHGKHVMKYGKLYALHYLCLLFYLPCS